MRKQKSLAFWLVLFSLLCYASCRKTDFEITTLEKPTSIDRFFNVPESADPRLKSIARSIKAQEKEYPFLEKFTKKTGWPVWAKAKVIDKRTMSNGRGSSVDSSALVYIPFVQDSAAVVDAVLAVRMNESDTAWRILYASNYASFGFDTTTSDNWNARNVFQFFALFQHDVFGHTIFRINDSRLFNSGDSATIRLKEINAEPITGRTNRTLEWHEYTQCGSWEVCRATPPPSEPRISSFPYCGMVSVCNTYYYDDGLDGTGGGTGWTGSSWSGSGGGGGSGSWANNDPCSGETNTCMAGWTPSNTYATLNGITYSTENYPGMNQGAPWLWWEDPIWMANNPFSCLEITFDVPDDLVINNGIELSDVPTGTPTTQQKLLAYSPDRGNTEDMQFGTNGDASGLYQHLLTKTDNELFSTMSSLFNQCTIFDGSLETVGDLMIDRFRNNVGGSFENTVLNGKVAASSGLQNYLKRFGEKLREGLIQANGDINSVPTINMLNDRPVFNGLYNKFHGLQILINDTEYTEINLDNFGTQNGKWYADVTVTIHDHFGLDKNDALVYQQWHQGFPSWWILQHMRNHRPFETVVKVKMRITITP